MQFFLNRPIPFFFNTASSPVNSAGKCYFEFGNGLGYVHPTNIPEASAATAGADAFYTDPCERASWLHRYSQSSTSRVHPFPQHSHPNPYS